MKTKISIWLEEEDLRRFRLKVKAHSFIGKGATSHFIEKIARESICFIPSNVRVVLEMKK